MKGSLLISEGPRTRPPNDNITNIIYNNIINKQINFSNSSENRSLNISKQRYRCLVALSNNVELPMTKCFKIMPSVPEVFEE